MYYWYIFLEYQEYMENIQAHGFEGTYKHSFKITTYQHESDTTAADYWEK